MVYFATVNFSIPTTTYAFFFIGISILSCTNNETVPVTEKKAGKNLDSSPNSIVSADENLVGISEGILVKEVERKESELLGLWQKIPLKGLKTAIRLSAGKILRQIEENTYRLEGPLMILYKSAPKEGTMDVFIGIPIQRNKIANRVKTGAAPTTIPADKQVFVIETIAPGKYYKATVNAAPGESLPKWQAFVSLLQSRKLLGIVQLLSKVNQNTPPYSYMEYYGDSRNSEMTSRIEQATLLIKIP